MNPVVLMMFVLPGMVFKEGYVMLSKHLPHEEKWWWRAPYIILIILVTVAAVLWIFGFI